MRISREQRAVMRLKTRDGMLHHRVSMGLLSLDPSVTVTSLKEARAIRPLPPDICKQIRHIKDTEMNENVRNLANEILTEHENHLDGKVAGLIRQIDSAFHDPHTHGFNTALKVLQDLPEIPEKSRILLAPVMIRVIHLNDFYINITGVAIIRNFRIDSIEILGRLKQIADNPKEIPLLRAKAQEALRQLTSEERTEA